MLKGLMLETSVLGAHGNYLAGLSGPTHKRKRDLCIIYWGSIRILKSQSESTIRTILDWEVERTLGGEGGCITSCHH
jgi:hypothetical protein